MRLAIACLVLLASPLAGQHPVAALVTEFDRIAARPLWPGFSPATTPLAIYDGERTWLLRHPTLPAGFAPSTELPGASVMQGQHAEVRANTHIQLDGVPTATLLWPTGRTDLTRLAATLLHETFHVYQAQAHPGWFGNEATLFTYPVTDSAAQALQRLETEALRRALAPGGDRQACWASRAMVLRDERARLVGSEAMAYERGNDLNEGLATWIEWRASGAPLDSLIPSAGFGSDAVRLRTYAVGPAQAFLLDRLRAGWTGELIADSTLTLDALLARATAPISCRAEFTGGERDSVAALAGRETARVLGHRAKLRRDFLDRAGWQLLIELPVTSPLWPEQFDPWNLTPLAGGEVLHQRHLRLGGERGRIDVLDQWALTSPAGAHPLFNGIRQVLLAGLAERPTITTRGDSLVVEGPGFQGRFTRMAFDVEGQRVTLHPR